MLAESPMFPLSPWERAGVRVGVTGTEVEVETTTAVGAGSTIRAPTLGTDVEVGASRTCAWGAPISPPPDSPLEQPTATAIRQTTISIGIRNLRILCARLPVYRLGISLYVRRAG